MTTYRISKNDALRARWLELPAMQEDIALGSNERLSHVEAAPVTLRNSYHNHDSRSPSRFPNACHVG